jgi:hypothetical protein
MRQHAGRCKWPDSFIATTKLRFQGPIVTHQFVRPRRLANLLPREKLYHHRLYVEHRRSVDRIEFGNKEPGALNTHHLADRAPDAIGPVFASLRKNPGRRPRRVISRMTRAAYDLGWLNLMEEEKDFDMRKVSNSQKSFGRKSLRESDARFFSAPEVILRMRTSGFDETNCLDLFDHFTNDKLPRVVRVWTREPVAGLYRDQLRNAAGRFHWH